MAQTGFTPIVSYHSTTGAAVPSAANLAPGEMALNINDMKLYAENSAGVVTLLAANVTAVANGGTSLATLTANNVILGNGASAPSFVAPSTSGNVLTSNGTTWTSAAVSATLTISNKTAAYTVVAGDLGTIINCTSGTFTVSLTAAATLASGFNCWVWNTSATATNAITIDPAAAETIDGLATLILRAGEGMQIICNGTNWETGDKKVMRGYAENILSTALRPVAVTGSGAIAIGLAYASGLQSFAAAIADTTASYGAQGSQSVAIGPYAKAVGQATFAIGRTATATPNYSTAIGQNSLGDGATTATGTGAMALGGSYASGTDSFAAAIVNNTSSYGATGANSVAIGRSSAASGVDAVSLGNNGLASGVGAVVISINKISAGATASGTASVAIGDNVIASGSSSYALGLGANSAVNGKWAYASGLYAAAGSAQTGLLILRVGTTDATATVLASTAVAPGTLNQVILPNNSAYNFRVQVVGMQQAAGGTGAAGYTFTGLIRRGANAAATVLLASAKTVDHETDAAWDCNVTADVTNGGLAVTVTGVAATNIRWVATAHTTEVTYA